MLSYTAKSKKVTRCDFCNGGNHVEWMCIVCDKIMCERCKAIHQRSKRYQTHKILKIQGAVEVVISQDGDKGKEFDRIAEKQVELSIGNKGSEKALKSKEVVKVTEKQVELSIGNKGSEKETKTRKLPSGKLIKNRRSLSIDDGKKSDLESKGDNILPQVTNMKIENKANTTDGNEDLTYGDLLGNDALSQMSHREKSRVSAYVGELENPEKTIHDIPENGRIASQSVQNIDSPDMPILQSPAQLIQNLRNISEKGATPDSYEQRLVDNLKNISFSPNISGNNFVGLKRMDGSSDKMFRPARPKVPRLTTSVLSQFSTKLRWINAICPVNKFRAWYGHVSSNSLFQIELENDKVTKTSTFDHKVTDIVILPDNEILVSYEEGKRISKIDQEGQFVKSFDMSPMCPQGMWVCKSGQLYVSLAEKIHAHRFPKCAVRIIKMSMEGEEIAKLEFDKKGKKIFSYPHSLVENINEDLCVVDMQSGGKVRLIVYNNKMDFRFIYDGKDKTVGGKPCDFGIVRNDSTGRLFISDFVYHRIHVLSKDGHFIQFLLTENDGIYFPFALAIDPGDFLWIDCKQVKNENAFSQILRIKYQ